MIDKIIEEASLLFRKQGYNGTTMDEIAAACSIKKPSLYYHIESREALLLRVIQRQQEEFFREVLSIAYRVNESVENRVTQLLIAMAAYFANRDNTCLISKLILELGETIPAIISFSARSLFDDWYKAFIALLKDFHTTEEIRYLTEDFFSQVQGALLLNQIDQNSSVLPRVFFRFQTLLLSCQSE